MNHEDYIEQAKACMNISKSKPQSEMTRDELIKSHLMLVAKIAHKYDGFNVDVEDLIAQGNIGLIKAAANFDHTKGAFGSLAGKYIKGEICEYIMKNNGQVAIKLTKSSVKEFFSSEKINTEITSVIVNSKSNNNVDAYDSESQVEGGANYINYVDDQSVKFKLLSHINKLDDRSKDIVISRYLADDIKSLKAIGEKYGISKSRVEQIEKSAVKKIRGWLV